MKFTLIDNPTGWWPVTVHVPGKATGGFEEGKFEVQFMLPSRAVIEDFDNEAGALKTVAEREAVYDRMLSSHVRGWRDIEDEDGNPIPFDEVALDRAMQHPHVRTALYAAFWQFVSGKAAGGAAKN